MAAHFPEFPRGEGPGTDRPWGVGEMQVEYGKTYDDFTRLTAFYQPTAIITFSRCRPGSPLAGRAGPAAAGDLPSEAETGGRRRVRQRPPRAGLPIRPPADARPAGDGLPKHAADRQNRPRGDVRDRRRSPRLRPAAGRRLRLRRPRTSAASSACWARRTDIARPAASPPATSTSGGTCRWASPRSALRSRSAASSNTSALEDRPRHHPPDRRRRAGEHTAVVRRPARRRPRRDPFDGAVAGAGGVADGPRRVLRLPRPDARRDAPQHPARQRPARLPRTRPPLPRASAGRGAHALQQGRHPRPARRVEGERPADRPTPSTASVGRAAAAPSSTTLTSRSNASRPSVATRSSSSPTR